MDKNLILYLFLLTFVSTCLQAQQLRFEPPRKLPKAINTPAEESAPVLSPDRSSLYFVRTLYKKNTGGQYAGQDIWMAPKDGKNLGDAHNDFPALNTEGNNAVISLSGDGKRAYVMNAYKDGGSSAPGISISYKSARGWSVPRQLKLPEVNTHELFYSACISADENIIIISKEGRDTYGREDLYVSKKKQDGTWSRWTNLGEVINTNEFETSPFLSSDGRTLFFSSQGHGGHGDADIFMTTRLDDTWTHWSAPVNLGAPVNSPAFDAYFIVTPDSVVYFSSNRDSRLSDLYISKLLPPEIKLTAVAKIDPKDPDLQSVVEIDRATYMKIKNEPQLQIIQDLFFDFDKYFLRDLSRARLKDIVSQVKGQEGIRVQLVGHTDNIGSADYNTVLSQKRALAARDYLVKLGVRVEQITAYWVGEEKPALENSSAANRQKNRRVEVFVSQPGAK